MMVPVRQWPLWVRYLIAFSVAAVLLVALIIYVNDHQAQSEGLPAAANKSQAAALERQARIVVAQQQAPHVVTAATSVPRAAASAAVTAYINDQVNHGFIAGPLDGTATCHSSGGTSRRPAFRCRVTAGATQTRLNYPFDAVVSGARVTYCQVVTSPDYHVPSPPVSGRCR